MIEISYQIVLIIGYSILLYGLELGLSQLICNQDHRFLAAQQCQAAGIESEIVLEPMGRNTAPAVILAALVYRRWVEKNPCWFCPPIMILLMYPVFMPL